MHSSDKRDHEIYKQMLSLSPGLEERLNNGTEQEIFYIAEMVWSDNTFHRIVVVDCQGSL